MKTFEVLSWAAMLVATPALAQTVEPGALPQKWATGGPNCLELPAWEIHEYNPTVYILRESGCTHYEKPFLYLIFGKDKALLVDTGAGKSDAAAVVGGLIDKWLAREKRASIELVVAHSHAHGDHVAGDAGFEGRPNTTLIKATVDAESKAFGIVKWPEDPGVIDLGDRVVDILAIPGHDAAHLAYYDRRTGLFLTGDHLYPGRLYVRDVPTYTESTRRMARFTADKPVAHILGCHIEQSATPFVDYPVGTKYQPDEHALALTRGTLLELLDALERNNGAKTVLRDITIVPR